MSCSEEKAVDGLNAHVNKEADAELEELRKENAKLKFRRDILLRNIDQLTMSAKNKSPMELDPLLYPKDADESYENCGHCGQNAMGLMTNIAAYLKLIFNEAISAAFPDATSECLPAVVMPSKKELAYQVNSAMKIANVIKSKGQSISPVQVAQKLIAHVPTNTLILSMDVAGPGFINVILNPAFLSREIWNFLINGIRVNDEKKDRVVIDYSSPNIAKEMHVGHLRSTIIGDCLANILEFLGHDVIRVNHVGDWGTQFGMLLAHFMEKYPDYLTSPPPISDLQSFYREAKKRFDEEEDFKKRAYAAVVQLQSKDPQMIEAWKSVCDVSRKEFQSVYEKLGVKCLREMGESFYHDLMKEVVKDLETREYLIEEEGRKVFFPSEESKKLFFPSDKSASNKEENVPLTIVKSDGGFTYDSSDLTCIRYRIQEMKASRIVYVVDNGQALHFHTIFACAKDCGYLDPTKVRVEHVGFGVVLGEDKKKFKTRSGDTVRLKDLLDEGLERARAKLREKNREEVLSSEELKEAEEAVAFGCIKYADLKQDRNRDYVFSFDRMLDDRGNTAVYLLYQLTRIRSIKRNANLQTETYKLAMEHEDVKLEHPKEIKLANYLVRFPEIICQVASDLFPHTLCAFLYELSGVFSEFYDQCYCIEKITGDDGSVQQKVNIDRILLCEATASIMEEGLNLLGIKTVSKM